MFFGFAAFGGKATQNMFFLGDLWFVGLGTPGLQRTTCPKNHYGIPLSLGYAIELPGRKSCILGGSYSKTH